MHLSITAAAWTKSWVCTSNTWWGRLSSKLPGRWELSLLAVKFNSPPQNSCVVLEREIQSSRWVYSQLMCSVEHVALCLYDKSECCVFTWNSFLLSESNCCDCSIATFNHLWHLIWMGDRSPFPPVCVISHEEFPNTVICQKWKLKWMGVFFSWALNKFIGKEKETAKKE